MDFLNLALGYFSSSSLNDFIELIDELLRVFGYGKFIIALFIGICLTYFGLRLENIRSVIMGFLFGLLVSKFISYIGVEWSHNSYHLPIAVFFAFLAYYVPRLISAMVGALLAVLLVIYLQIKIQLLIVAIVLVGGVLGALFYSPMVIFSTAFLGSISLLFVVVNAIPLLENGKLEWTSKTLFGVISLVGKHVFTTMSLKTAVADAIIYGATLSIICISGIVYQMKYWLTNSLHIKDLVRAVNFRKKPKYEPHFDSSNEVEKHKRIEPTL